VTVSDDPKNDQVEQPVTGFTLPDAETNDEDYGHYSVVIAVRSRDRLLVIADPYKDDIDQDRIFSYNNSANVGGITPRFPTRRTAS
jgi:hypothetical protein